MKKAFIALILLTSITIMAQPSCLLCETDPPPPAAALMNATIDYASLSVLDFVEVAGVYFEFHHDQIQEYPPTKPLEAESQSDGLKEMLHKWELNESFNKVEGHVQYRQIPDTALQIEYRTSSIISS